MPFTTVCPEPSLWLYFGAVVGYVCIWALVVAAVCAFFLGRKP
jgi:hypothetical protein